MPRMFLILLGVGCVVSSTAVASEPTPEAIKSALDKAIPLIKGSTVEYPKHRQCFSCHHQAVPVFALKLARSRGFDVNDQAIRSIAEHTEADLESAIDDYQKGKGQPGGVERAGYALFTLEIAGVGPDEVTKAVADYLMVADKNIDHWRSRSNRPPSEASDFTTSYLAMRGLRVYGGIGQKEQIAERLKTVGQWMKTSKGKDTEDRVFRLLALRELDADSPLIKEAAGELVKQQNDDGGWPQLDGKESDVYATGSVLVALHKARELATEDPAYRRGLAFLITTQLADGSWHVVSRSKPFQPYFESGFPHGNDQFISMAASSWAASALLLATPEVK